MILFVLLFISLMIGFVYSIIKILKEHSFNILQIVSIANVLLFILIFIFAK